MTNIIFMATSVRIKNLARDLDAKRFQRDYVWLKEAIKAEEIGRALAEIDKRFQQIKSDVGYNLISKKYGNS